MIERLTARELAEKLGGRLRFRESEVLDWLERERRRSKAGS